jgi:hypothetical protein
MSIKLLLRIVHRVRCYDDYFSLEKDATCKLGFTSFHALQLLACSRTEDPVT